MDNITIIDILDNTQEISNKFLALAEAEQNPETKFALLCSALDYDVSNQKIKEELLNTVKNNHLYKHLMDLLILCGDLRSVQKYVADFQFVNKNKQEAYTHFRLAYNQSKTNAEKEASAHDLSLFCKSIGDIQKALIFSKLTLKYGYTNPNNHNNLAVILTTQSEHARALDHYDKAFQYSKSNIDRSIFLMNKGLLLSQMLKWNESTMLYDRAIKEDTCNSLAMQNKIFDLNYTNLSDREIFERSKGIDKYWKIALREPYVRKDNPKIGIITSELLKHPCYYFLKAILDNMEITVFSTVFTEKKDYFNCQNMSDEQLSTFIKSKGIDILIDVSVHTNNNKLRMLSLRPAPIIVNFLGMPNTSGSKIHDYRIVDKITDNTDTIYTSEKLSFFKNCFLCFDADHIAFTLKPRLENDPFRFCCFNKIQKISPDYLNLVRRVLIHNPDAVILFKNRDMMLESSKKYILDHLHDINPERIEFIGFKQDDDHYETYNSCDVQLDTFPYNGTTTTADSLYCGVPVLTLKGTTHRGRVSSSILHHSNLDEWVCESDDDFCMKSKTLRSKKEDIKALFEDGKCMNDIEYVNDFKELMVSLV